MSLTDKCPSLITPVACSGCGELNDSRNSQHGRCFNCGELIPAASGEAESQPCQRCNGNGRVPIDGEWNPRTGPCPDCKGTGKESATSRENRINGLHKELASLSASQPVDAVEQARAQAHRYGNMTLGQTMNRLDELAAKNQALQQEVDRLKTVPKFKEQVHIDRMVKAGCLISVDGTELVIQNQRAETAESRVSELERELADMRANRDAAEAHIEDLQRELAKGKEQRA